MDISTQSQSCLKLVHSRSVVPAVCVLHYLPSSAGTNPMYGTLAPTSQLSGSRRGGTWANARGLPLTVARQGRGARFPVTPKSRQPLADEMSQILIWPGYRNVDP